MDMESMGPLRPQTFLFGNARRDTLSRGLLVPSPPQAPGPSAVRVPCRAAACAGRAPPLRARGMGGGALPGPGACSGRSRAARTWRAARMWRGRSRFVPRFVPSASRRS